MLKVREKFEENRHLNDLEAIDYKINTGYMELREIMMHWAQKTHIMRHFAREESPNATFQRL